MNVNGNATPLQDRVYLNRDKDENFQWTNIKHQQSSSQRSLDCKSKNEPTIRDGGGGGRRVDEGTYA